MKKPRSVKAIVFLVLFSLVGIMLLAACSQQGPQPGFTSTRMLSMRVISRLANV
jgi:purine-cytosine permease-like protein